MAKKTYLEQLGLETITHYTVAICRKRVKHLEKLIAGGKLTPRLLKQAKYYRSWNKWIAKNGGKRPVAKKKAAKKVAKKTTKKVVRKSSRKAA